MSPSPSWGHSSSGRPRSTSRRELWRSGPCGGGGPRSKTLDSLSAMVYKAFVHQAKRLCRREAGSRGRTRTYGQSVNSRLLYH